MVKGKNSAALKQYHACARRSKCGKKYSAKRKNTGDDENLQSLRKRLRKKRPAKKRPAKKKKQPAQSVEPLQPIPRQKPRKTPPYIRNPKGGVNVQGNVAPIQRGEVLRAVQRNYLQRGADNPFMRVVEEPPMVYPANYEKNTEQFFKQVERAQKRKIKKTGLGRGGRKRGRKKRTPITLQAADTLRAFDELAAYRQLQNLRDVVEDIPIPVDTDDKLFPGGPTYRGENWIRENIKGAYLTRLDKMLGEN